MIIETICRLLKHPMWTNCGCKCSKEKHLCEICDEQVGGEDYRGMHIEEVVWLSFIHRQKLYHSCCHNKQKYEGKK